MKEVKSASILKFSTGKIIIHSKSRIKDGPSYATPPYFIEQHLSYKEIAERLLEALKYSLDDAPEPLDWKFFRKGYLKKMEVKTMKALHDGSINIGVFTKDGNYYISPTKNMGSREGFQGDIKDRIIIPLDSSLEELSKALEEAFKRCS